MALLAAAIGTCFAARLSAQAPTPPESSEYSVLTPAVETHIVVATGLTVTDFLPIIDGLGDLSKRGNSLKLRKLAATDRFDPARRLADRLVEALAEAGHTATYEPIARKPAGSIQSLSWTDLPEAPQGKLMLDVTIRLQCLCKGDIEYSGYAPALALGWRVLDPRGEVVEPTRVLTYVHKTGWSQDPKPSSTRTAKAPPIEPRYPLATVSDSCSFDKVDDAFQNPPVIWGCFGEALDVASHRIVMDLDRARQAHKRITALSDSPSGTSTR